MKNRTDFIRCAAPGVFHQMRVPLGHGRAGMAQQIGEGKLPLARHGQPRRVCMAQGVEYDLLPRVGDPFRNRFSVGHAYHAPGIVEAHGIHRALKRAGLGRHGFTGAACEEQVGMVASRQIPQRGHHIRRMATSTLTTARCMSGNPKAAARATPS